MKRLLCMILTVLIALGCLTPMVALADQTKPLGGYVETEIKLPEGYLSPTAPASTPDGKLAVAALNAEGGWVLLTWDDISAGPMRARLNVDEGKGISSIAFSPEGELLCVYFDEPVMGGERRGNLSTGDGEPKQAPEQADDTSGDEQSSSPDAAGAKVRMFTADDMKTSFAWFDARGQRLAGGELRGMTIGIQPLSGRRLVALRMSNGIAICDETGKQLSEIAKNDAFNMAVSPNGLLLHQGGKLYELDIDTGKSIREIPFDADYGTPLLVASDGTVYAVSSKGIQRLSPDADAFETVADAAGYTIGDPSNYISGACALSGGTLAVMLGGGGGGVRVSGSGGRTNTSVNIGGDGGDGAQLLAYVFNPDMDLSNRTPFRVSALRDNAKLRKAVSDFQRLHPELDVSLTAPIADGDFETPVEDHIRTLNTDLLAGKGGDVLVLDGLPVEKYIEKGVLADLSALADGLGMLPGILQGSKAADGKLYALPTQFSFDTLWGGKDAIAQLSGIESVANMALADGQTPMYGRTPEDWLRLFYPACEASFRGEDGKLNFDTPEFARFLDALWTLYAAQAEQPDDEDSASMRQGGFSMKEAQAAMNGSVALMPGRTESTMQSAIYFTATGKANSAVSLVPGLDGPGSAYAPSLLMGVNARSDNKALAEEFVRLMFSDELQKMERMDGLPSVAAALDALVDIAIEQSKDTGLSMAVMMAGGTEPLVLDQPDEAHWREIRALCDQLNTAAPLDETLMGFIVEETASFFQGTSSADEAASAVMQRAMAYLNE